MMTPLRYFVAIFALAGVCFAKLPDCYKTVNRVVWVVRDLNRVIQGWIELGLSDVHEYPDGRFTGRYLGKPVAIPGRHITGHLGNLTIDMIQPTTGQRNAFTDFLARHGDGVFAVVHEVSSKEEMASEVKRMSGLGVALLQQVTVDNQSTSVEFTYFDTEPRGKFVVGLLYWPGGAPRPEKREMISHLAPVVRESADVSVYWQSLGFPQFRMEHATPREDSRYRGKPLWFAFEVGYQHYDQFNYEWIIPPMTPANIYADFLKLHGEGIQHLGMPVDDLKKAVAEYEKHGYRVWQSGAWGAVGEKNSGQYAYMDTDSIGGVSVELVHAF
jgi:hypothetical protein